MFSTPVDIGRPNRGKTSVAYRLVAPRIAVTTQVLQELTGVIRLHHRVSMEVAHCRLLHQTLKSPLLIIVESDGYRLGLDNLLSQWDRARSRGVYRRAVGLLAGTIESGIGGPVGAAGTATVAAGWDQATFSADPVNLSPTERETIGGLVALTGIPQRELESELLAHQPLSTSRQRISLAGSRM